MVVESRAFYKKSARFDDELVVQTELAELKRASLRFDYTLLRGDETIATGYTWHGCVDLATGKPRRIPKSLMDRLSPS